MTKQQNDFKIKLKELEDSLLSRLSSAGGNFLGDTALVENLEITKRTAAEIEQKVSLEGGRIIPFACLLLEWAPSLFFPSSSSTTSGQHELNASGGHYCHELILT